MPCEAKTLIPVELNFDLHLDFKSVSKSGTLTVYDNHDDGKKMLV